MEWREGDMAIQGRGKERRRQGHTGKRKGEKKTRPYREEERRGGDKAIQGRGKESGDKAIQGRAEGTH